MFFKGTLFNNFKICYVAEIKKKFSQFYVNSLVNNRGSTTTTRRNNCTFSNCQNQVLPTAARRHHHHRRQYTTSTSTTQQLLLRGERSAFWNCVENKFASNFALQLRNFKSNMSAGGGNGGAATMTEDTILLNAENLSIPSPISENAQGKQPRLRLNNIKKSEQDSRDYRGLQLENGLKVLLVSDPKTDISAAALAVQVGHMSDPDDLPGLAHFCEHMLFLGTEKYPNENDYTTYLSQSGGSSNAATYPLMTKYYFHVAPDKLNGALDRFAQFFISPLFTISATDREIKAVNSEHEKNLSSDAWRIKQVHKHLAKPDHPYSKFGSGNNETLNEIPKRMNLDVREQLLQFHKKWYSANIMSLAVIGKETLNELEEMVLEKFSEIENKNIEVPHWEREPYSLDSYGQRVKIVPVKDLRSLTISFTTDDLTKFYRSSPDGYLSHLVGHEGKGSLLSELRNLGWCNDLIAGLQNILNGFGFFEIVVDLTVEGMNHVEDIVNIVFQYLRMLREVGPQKWIYDECVKLNEMRFRFKDKDQPENLVTQAVSSMQIYPLAEVLTAPYLSLEWRPDLITALLDEMVPSKCRIITVAQSYESEANKTEPYYKTKYSTLKIDSAILKRWETCELNPNLALPQPNAFMPSSLEIAAFDADLSKYPIILIDTPILRVWHKQDDQFLMPKACMSFDMSNPIAYLDPLNCCLNQLMISLLKDQLNEYLYDATLAGLKLHVFGKTTGVQFTIRGYSDKQTVLLEKLLNHMFEFKIDEKRFTILKEDYIRVLKNFKAEQPYQHATYYLALILTENAWSNNELLDALQLVTFERVQNFGKEFFQRMHTECFIYGNVNKAQALSIANRVSKRLEATNAQILPILARQMFHKREIKLVNGESYLFEHKNEFHKTSCAQMYFQCGPQNDYSNIMINLITQIMSEPCYDCLRTKEQLGYIVFSGARKVNGANGIRVFVQSTKPPVYVEERIENFLESFMKMIQEMPLEEFERHKEALAVKKLEKPKTIYQQFRHFQSEIVLALYHFERYESEVALLRKIKKDEFIDAVAKYISKDGAERRLLSVYIHTACDEDHQQSNLKSNDTTSSDAEMTTCGDQADANANNMTAVDSKKKTITDIASFRASKELYPLVAPILDIRGKGGLSKL